jgi:sortase A
MLIRVRAKPPRKLFGRAAANTLILIGSVGVLVWAWAMLDTALYQHVQKVQLERRLPQSERPAATEMPRAAPEVPAVSEWVPREWFRRDPLVIGEIEIPRLEMSVIVREGMDDTTLRKAAGHVPATALPGESGNFVVLGHRDTLFRPLRGLEKGDTVRVRTVGGSFNYWIDTIEVVPPEGVDLRTKDAQEITLVTCFPFDYLGPAPRRFVAHGHLQPQLSAPGAAWPLGDSASRPQASP